MTRLAIVSDIHADRHALQNALAQIERLGCDLTVCAGDLIDFGRSPEKTIGLLRDRGISTIRGNHDRWALEQGQDMSGRELSARAVAFLSSLPTHWSATIDV